MTSDSPKALPFPLPDGSTVLLRPVNPDDKERLREGLRQLSPRSRYMRFFSSVDHFTDQQLEYLTNPDQVNHVAWGAVDPEDPVHHGLGIARFVRLEEEPAAEMAIAIADDYQHRGLGKILMGVLYLHARERKIRSLTGILLPENRAVFRALKELGATLERQGKIFLLSLPVYGDLAHLPGTPSGDRFRRLLSDLNERLALGADL